MGVLHLEVEPKQPPTMEERVPYSALRSRCYSGRLINRGAAAAESFMSDFEMAEADFSQLPPELATVMSPGEQMEKVGEIMREGGRLGDVVDFTMAAPSFDYSRVHDLKRVSITDGDGWVQDWTWLARGDFNRDGIEDILVSSRLYMPGGSFVDDHRLFVLTRTADDSPVELLQEIPLYPGDETGLCGELVSRCGREVVD